MAKHRKFRSHRSLLTVVPGVGTGIAGIALAGFGALIVTANVAPPPAPGVRVQLATTEWALTPTCLLTDPGCSPSSGSTELVGNAGTVTPTALLAAIADRPIIGTGGWLIGNGLDAPTDCTGDECNGGDGGLLWGNGGNGANGG